MTDEVSLALKPQGFLQKRPVPIHSPDENRPRFNALVIAVSRHAAYGKGEVAATRFERPF